MFLRSRTITVRVAAGETAEPTAKAEAAKPAEKTPLDSLEVGKTYSGVVRSVQTYGAFIDIGAASDGLAHISQLSAGFVKDPNDVVQVGQSVEARVLSVDAGTKRFSLTLKKEGEEAPPRGNVEMGEDGRPVRSGKVATRRNKDRKPRADAPKPTEFKVNDEISGKTQGVTGFGVFVELPEGFKGLLHKDEVKSTMAEPNLRNMFPEGTEVKVRVLSIGDDGKIALTQKTEEERAPFKPVAADIDRSNIKTQMELELAKLGIASENFPTTKV